MRSVKKVLRPISGLIILVPVALGLILPQVSSAATPVWKVAGKEVSSSTIVKPSGKLQFFDSHGGFFGESLSLKCSLSGEVSVGSKGSGEILSLKASGCTSYEGICPAPTVVVKHLPWHVELTDVEEHARASVSTGSGGSPEYQLECEGYLDACSGAATAVTTNVAGGVNLAFEEPSSLKCTVGGANKGGFKGTALLENPATGQLTVSDAPAAEGWFLNSVRASEGTAVKSTGNLKFRSKAGIFGEEVAIRCAEEGRASVGAYTSGEVTKWATSGCVTEAGVCGSPTVGPLSLPWHTELVLSGGKLIDRISNGNLGGEPGYIVSCDGLAEFTCSWPTSTSMENSSPQEYVDAWYPESGLSSGTCSRGIGNEVSGLEKLRSTTTGFVLTVK